MGAPTGSGEVRIVTRPRVRATGGAPDRNPTIVTTAGAATEPSRMAFHTASLGCQDRADAW